MSSCALRVAALILLLVATPVVAAIIIVPDDQPTVQDAVDVAAPFDVIQVRPGLVPDRVLVTGKTDLRIENLGGRPVFPPANRKDGFDVRSSSRVWLQGFDFQSRKTPVRLTDCTDCTVLDMHATACREGILAVRSTRVTVVGNSLVETGKGRGISVDGSPDAQVLGNTVSDGKGEGIRITRSDGAQVLVNDSSGNRHGIVMRDCPDAG